MSEWFSSGTGATKPAAAAGEGGAPRSDRPPSQQVRRAIETLVSGGDADFDGDGVVDATTTVEGDTVRTIYFGAPGKPRLTIVTRGDAVDVEGDFNEDGTPDFKHTGATVGAVRTQTSTWDTNFDGVIDERETVTFTGELGSGKPIHRLSRYERPVYDATTHETTVKVSERVDDGIDSDGGRDLLAGFPTKGVPVVLDTNHPNIRIYEQTPATPNGCSEAQVDRIAEALKDLVERQIGCLSEANTTAAAALGKTVASRKIEVACVESPTEFGAAEVGPLLAGEPEKAGAYRLNISPHTFDGPGLGATFLHEMMHISGYTHTDEMEESAKTDRVNSCASLCSKCVTGGMPSMTPGQDCARCSEPGKKRRCGVKKGREGTRNCHREHLAACIIGEGPKIVDCAFCQKRTERLCDGTLISQDDMPLCCERCPPDTRNNLECGEVHGYQVNSCDDLPEACK